MSTRPNPTPPAKPEPEAPLSYVLEQRLLKAYATALYAPDRCPEALAQAVWGQARPLTEKQLYGRPASQARPNRIQPGKTGRIDWLDDNAPDVIRLLHARAQQDTLAGLLLADTPDLVGAVRYLWKLGPGSALRQRDTDANLRINDEARAKAAGMGRLSRASYANAGSFRRAEDTAPLPAPAPRPVVPVLVPPRPKPAPVLVYVEMPRPKPVAAVRPRRGQWQPWHGRQLGLGL